MTPKDLPENVEEALGTINNYLANPNQNVSDTTTTTKKVIQVVEFSSQRNKIGKIFANKSTYTEEITEF